jgi:hypothetical protein
MTKWQKADTPEEAKAIVASWHGYGFFTETLTDEDMARLREGGYLCVFQDEYGLILRYVHAPETVNED